MITFRLADSMPATKLSQWREELQALPHLPLEAEFRKRIERHLDQGHGSAALGRPEIAGLVEDPVLNFDGERYSLHAWVIMPNHVHAMVTLGDGYDLAGVMHSWKSYTASVANRLLCRKGAFWQREYFDRYIRDARHYEAALRYIEWNPVTAGLCGCAEEWPFGSARWRAM